LINITERRISYNDYEPDENVDINHEYQYIDDIKRCPYCHRKLEKITKHQDIYGHWMSYDEYYCSNCD
jgi:uncharacterized protein with PIN domain